jgi:hypothetical protein
LADFFEVDEATINRWKERKEGFCEALKAGKERADATVADRLYKRATGFTIDEEKIFCNANGEVTRVKVKKYFPPSVTAQIYWTKNRQPREWRDARQIDANVDMKGEIDVRLQEARKRFRAENND